MHLVHRTCIYSYQFISLSVTNQVKLGQMLIRARVHHWQSVNGPLSVLKREQAVQVLHFLHCFQAVTTALAQVDREKIYQWINELSSPETRENALLELSKKRESVPDLAPMLWHSCGTIAALLQVRTVFSAGNTTESQSDVNAVLSQINWFCLEVHTLSVIWSSSFVGNRQHLPVNQPPDPDSTPVQQSM